MPGDIAAVRDKVQQLLVDLFGGVEVDRDGDFTFRHGPVQVWVEVNPFHETNTAVKVYAILCMGMPASPELFHHVATRGSYVFGNLRCNELDEGVSVVLAHSLLGETLDAETFKVAVFMVAGIGSELAPELRARFGGTVFHQ